jgi:hypothetical protein
MYWRLPKLPISEKNLENYFLSITLEKRTTPSFFNGDKTAI